MRIAKRLDAAVGALYRYFPGKDALMVGLQQQALSELDGFIGERVGTRRQALRAHDASASVKALTLVLVIQHFIET